MTREPLCALTGILSEELAEDLFWVKLLLLMFEDLTDPKLCNAFVSEEKEVLGSCGRVLGCNERERGVE